MSEVLVSSELLSRLVGERRRSLTTVQTAAALISTLSKKTPSSHVENSSEMGVSYLSMGQMAGDCEWSDTFQWMGLTKTSDWPPLLGHTSVS